MTEKATEQQIKSYLLGELPEEEAELIEESLFTDDEMFSEVQTAEMSLVDGYVRNELPQDEKAKFETQYLVTSERRQKVSAARLFHDELNAIRPMPEIVEAGAGWFKRVFGSWRLPVLQYASGALVLLLAISTSWLFYDGWKTRNELAMARNSLANSEAVLNQRLAEKEQQLNSKLAEQRGEDAQSLSDLQAEVEGLHQQLEEIKRKSSNTNTSIPPSPTIATIFLPVARSGGPSPLASFDIPKDSKVVNIRIPISREIGEPFSIDIGRNGNALLKFSNAKAINSGGTTLLSISVPSKTLTAGTYTVEIHGQDGATIKRAFSVNSK